jgi:hypothetical protein
MFKKALPQRNQNERQIVAADAADANSAHNANRSGKRTLSIVLRYLRPVTRYSSLVTESK